MLHSALVISDGTKRDGMKGRAASSGPSPQTVPTMSRPPLKGGRPKQTIEK